MEKRNIVTGKTPPDTAKTAEVFERGAKAFEKTAKAFRRLGGCQSLRCRQAAAKKKDANDD